MLAEIERLRLSVSENTDPKRKSQFGQYLTSASIANYMAELFDSSGKAQCRLLDAGAGVGSLTAAFLDRWDAGRFGFRHVQVDAFEIDERLHPFLAQTLGAYEARVAVKSTIRGDDFVEIASNAICGDLFDKTLPKYTHVILNPPYKKIRSNSAYRFALRRAGIETVNLYSGFLALALSLLEPKGQLVAIVPRSFCNGPYYRPFREYILERAAIRHIHLFSSRSSIFKKDAVLQENVIIRLDRGVLQEEVRVTTSSDDQFSDMTSHNYPFGEIVSEHDTERFIHIPTSPEMGILERATGIHHRLDGLGIKVSTGPVVDFRLKEFLQELPNEGDVPLLYPGHFQGWYTQWPNENLGKPNAIRRTPITEKCFYPNGFYCAVRRFSAKEEKRRVVASVVRPDSFPEAEVLGFENHMNIFHEDKHGMSEALAYGLTAFLNTTAVDESFRRFNGHTQVNATDLRSLKYPSREALMALGKWAVSCKDLSQNAVDAQLDLLGHEEKN